MNESDPAVRSPRRNSHPFVVQLLVSIGLVVAVPVGLWILADPAAALLTLTAAGLAGLLVVGAVETVDEDGRQEN